MNEALAKELLWGFLGLLGLGVVLLVLRLTLLNSSKVTRWQRLAADRGWTLTHRPTQSRQWEVAGGTWLVWREEPLREDLSVRVVLEMPVDREGRLLVVGRALWEQWQPLLQEPSTAQKLRRVELGLDRLPGVLNASTEVPGQESFVVFSDDPQEALVVLPAVLKCFAALPVLHLEGNAFLWLEGKQMRVQVNDAEWDEPLVLALVEAGQELQKGLSGEAL